MLEAFDINAWDHTASLIACVTGLMQKGVTVEQYHPYRRRESAKGPRATGETLRSMKGMFSPWVDPDDIEDQTTARNPTEG